MPVALGIIVLVWVLRSEAFARRVGAFATRATGAVLRRIHRDPVDLTDRLLDFRDSAKDLLLARAVPMAITLLPIAPGGAGLPELPYISFFTRLVGDPAYDDQIAAGVMLMRGMSWFLPIPVGNLVLVIQRRSLKHRPAAGLPEPPAMAGAGDAASSSSRSTDDAAAQAARPGTSRARKPA